MVALREDPLESDLDIEPIWVKVEIPITIKIPTWVLGIRVGGQIHLLEPPKDQERQAGWE